jgi:hypothetical protein
VIKEGDFIPRHTDNSDEVSDEESQASDKFHCNSVTTNTRKVHLYNESYLSSCHIPLYLVCSKRLTNAARLQQN